MMSIQCCTCHMSGCTAHVCIYIHLQLQVQGPTKGRFGEHLVQRWMGDPMLPSCKLHMHAMPCSSMHVLQYYGSMVSL